MPPRPQSAEHFFNPEESERIIAAIQKAESTTSGEIRIHLEDHCPEEVIATAKMVFERLGMRETDERNGVLIFIAIKDRKMAVIGDDGIHAKVASNFWQEVVAGIKANFATEAYEKGLIEAVNQLGTTLSEHFPWQPGSEDELEDEFFLLKSFEFS